VEGLGGSGDTVSGAERGSGGKASSGLKGAMSRGRFALPVSMGMVSVPVAAIGGLMSSTSLSFFFNGEVTSVVCITVLGA
jgi:hypothetical protein